jgi:hypothetical protein
MVAILGITAAGTGTQFTCFTSSKVQILTPEELGDRHSQRSSASASPCFTCFTSTEVQILTPELLALLVQRYKY